MVILPVYSAGSMLPARRARQVLVFGIVVALVGTLASPGPTDPAVPTFVALAWLLGSYVGRQRAYTAELERRNALLAQAQADLADRAVGEERLRLARELHDVVAHTMSVVAVHAGTGRMVADSDPAAAKEALATIETSTRAALLEMRRLLGVLRGADGDGPGSLAPAPGLRDLDALVAEVVRSGVDVDVRVEGDRPEVPAGVDLSGYRIVQEALTNVLKHAGGAKATVVVRYANDSVTVEVDDEGARRARDDAAVSGAARPRRHAGAGDDVRRRPPSRPPGRRGLPGVGPSAVRGAGMTVRVGIADDQPLIRTGLRAMIEHADDLELIGEAEDGDQAIDLGAPAPARRRAHGHPHAQTGRHRGDAPHHRGRRPRRRAGADPHDLRPRRVRLRRHQGRGERLRAEGRTAGGGHRRHPHRGPWRRAPRAEHHPPAHRGPGGATRPRPRTATRAGRAHRSRA